MVGELEGFSVGVFAGLQIPFRSSLRVVIVRAKGKKGFGLPGGRVEWSDIWSFRRELDRFEDLLVPFLVALERELREELGISFPLGLPKKKNVRIFISENENIRDIALVFRIAVSRCIIPQIFQLLEKLPFDSEIEEAILIDKIDLTHIPLIGPRMKRMVEFALS